MNYKLTSLSQKPELLTAAAHWFHEKWGIPLEEYQKSMEECLQANSPVPQWYLALKGTEILGGMGVIENDFHNRKDLAPNVCAVYTEEAYRNQGIAKALLHYLCQDMAQKGIHTLYLLTDHTAFYERCGWKFLCMVQGDGDSQLSRMYIHESSL